MADLVRHVYQVHRSWARIVGEQIMEPDWVDAPYPPDDELVDSFVINANHMADVFAATDPATPCWTGAGGQRRICAALPSPRGRARWTPRTPSGRRAPSPPTGPPIHRPTGGHPAHGCQAAAPNAIRVEAADAGGGNDVCRPATGGELRGPASDLLLVLWHRLPLSTVTVDGDEVAVQASLNAIN